MNLWGVEMKKIAQALDLPTDNANQIHKTFIKTSTFLYGEETKSDIIEETNDQIVERVTDCALLKRAIEHNLDPKKAAFIVCNAYRKYGVESLNPYYTNRFKKSMCSGDPYCECVIGRWK